MCMGGGCEGACERPRFTQHAAGPDLRVVGTAAGVTDMPDSVVRRNNGMITYEDLYTGLGPDGKPSLMILPGTFGTYAQKAGRA